MIVMFLVGLLEEVAHDFISPLIDHHHTGTNFPLLGREGRKVVNPAEETKTVHTLVEVGYQDVLLPHMRPISFSC